jgi:hypothetical protein
MKIAPIVCIAILAVALRSNAQNHSWLSIPEAENACEKADMGKGRHPVMSPRKDGVAYGVSTLKDDFKSGEELRVCIWLSNESDKDVMATMCCEQTFLLYIEVLDASGRPLTSASELRKQKALREGKDWIVICTCSGPTKLYPPGFRGVIDTGTLNRPDNAYSLSPGEYIVLGSEPREPSIPTRNTGTPAKTAGLKITIEP